MGGGLSKIWKYPLRRMMFIASSGESRYTKPSGSHPDGFIVLLSKQSLDNLLRFRQPGVIESILGPTAATAEGDVLFHIDCQGRGRLFDGDPGLCCRRLQPKSKDI